jgi:hypothetical protein
MSDDGRRLIIVDRVGAAGQRRWHQAWTRDVETYPGGYIWLQAPEGTVPKGGLTMVVRYSPKLYGLIPEHDWIPED